MIDDVKNIQSNIFLVGFKAETNISKKDLINKAREKINHSGCDLMIANDIGTKRYKENPDFNNVIAIDSNKIKESGWKSKSKIVKFIRNEIEARFS